MKFKEHWLDAHSQEITRVVFYRDDAAVIYTRGNAFSCFGIEEKVKSYLIERFGDTEDKKLKIALSIVAGSDIKDFKTFRYVTKIYDFFEISKEVGEKGIKILLYQRLYSLPFSTERLQAGWYSLKRHK